MYKPVCKPLVPAVRGARFPFGFPSGSDSTRHDRVSSAADTATALMAAVLALWLSGSAPASAQTIPAPLAAVAEAAGPTSGVSAAASVTIRSVWPEPGTVLRAGERMRIEVEAAYRQPGDSATLALSVQETAPDSRPLAAAVKPVKAHEGVERLSVEFVVPEVRSLRVYLPLYLKDGQPTQIVAVQDFAVAPR